MHTYVPMVQCTAVLRYPSHAQAGWFSYQHSAVPCRDTVLCLWSRTAHVIEVFRLSPVSVLMMLQPHSSCVSKYFIQKLAQIFFYCAALLHIDRKGLEEPASVTSKYVFLAFLCLIFLIDLFCFVLFCVAFFFLCRIWEEWEAWDFIYSEVAKAVGPRLPHLKACFVVGLWLGLGFEKLQVESSIRV